NVDEEHRAPRIAVGDPPAKRRPDDRRGYDRDAVNRKGRRELLGRERVYKDRLLDGRESATARSLQHPKEDEPSEARRESAKERAYGKQGHREHVVVLTPHQSRQPCTQREHDRIRDEITAQDPRRF